MLRLSAFVEAAAVVITVIAVSSFMALSAAALAYGSRSGWLPVVEVVCAGWAICALLTLLAALALQHASGRGKR